MRVGNLNRCLVRTPIQIFTKSHQGMLCIAKWYPLITHFSSRFHLFRCDVCCFKVRTARSNTQKKWSLLWVIPPTPWASAAPHSMPPLLLQLQGLEMTQWPKRIGKAKSYCKHITNDHLNVNTLHIIYIYLHNYVNMCEPCPVTELWWNQEFGSSKH